MEQQKRKGFHSKYFRLTAIAAICAVGAGCRVAAPAATLGVSLPVIFGDLPVEMRQDSRPLKQAKPIEENGVWTAQFVEELIIPVAAKPGLARLLERAAIKEVKRLELDFDTFPQRPELANSFSVTCKNDACQAVLAGNIVDVSEVKTRPGYVCVRVVLTCSVSEY
jgi:hypothetical protein